MVRGHLFVGSTLLVGIKELSYRPFLFFCMYEQGKMYNVYGYSKRKIIKPPETYKTLE